MISTVDQVVRQRTETHQEKGFQGRQILGWNSEEKDSRGEN